MQSASFYVHRNNYILFKLSSLLNFAALFLFVLLVFSTPVYGQEKFTSINIVSDDNYPPYIFRNEKGELQGIIVDEWKLWEQKTGIHVNLIAKDWNKAYRYMLDGNADVLETVFYNEDRARIFDFTKAYTNIEVPVFFHKTLSGISDVKNLRGFTIGVKAGDACINIFKQNGITTLKEYGSYEAIIKAAGSGEVRVFCIDKPPAIYYLYKYNLENDFKYSFTLYNGEFHRAVKKGRTDLLKTVERGFSLITKSEYNGIASKWLGTSIPQNNYLQYAIYSILGIGIIAIFLGLISFILRKRVKDKTRQLETAFVNLSKSEDKYRSIFETANEGICVTDKNGNIVTVNSKFQEMTGYSAEELLYHNFYSFFNSNHKPDANGNPEICSAPERLDYELYLSRKDRSPLWTYVARSPILDNAKKYGGLVEMFTDITERKLAEEEIRKLFRGVEQSPAAIVITNKDGDIEYVNSKFIETTGYSYNEVLGKNPRILSSGETSSEEYKILWETIKSGNDWKGEFHNKKKNGELYWESVSISPIKNEKGEITHFIEMKEDITEKKKMIEDLIAAKEKAEEMNRLKSSFLANMSHELRTPLVGILGYTDILESRIDDPEMLGMVKGINRGGKRLRDTLSLILDLSRAESNKIEIHSRLINLADTIPEIVNSFYALAIQKDIKLRTIRKAGGTIANLDERLFSNILNNLINNAIKYTNYGEVTVEFGSEIKEDKEWVYIKVIDTGIGISEKDQVIIFNEFRQVSEGFGRNFEGLGLGLTISKKAANVMGGDITVESELGAGSTFTVKFPAFEGNVINGLTADGQAVLSSEIKPLQNETEKPLLLYVEDDKTSQEVVKIYLKKHYTVDIAEDGVTALEMMKSKKYVGFLMDINLGRGINGIAVTQEIKKIPEYNGVPIIAITAFAMKGDKEEFLSSGCTHYISKPFSQKELLNLIIEAFQKQLRNPIGLK
jgi:PAS domain S-box-containing protein